MIYTVTCNPAIDYVLALEGKLKCGGINRNLREEFQFGGKGINVSRMLKNLGFDSIALGFVAGFTGETLERGLADMGLKTRFIHTASGMTRINVKIKAEEETEINGIGPVVTDEGLEKLCAQLDEMREGDILVLSGSVPRGRGADTYERLLDRVKDRGIRAVVDADGDLLLGTLKYRPFLIKPNQQELASIFGTEPENDAEILSCAQKLREMGAENVLVSLAGDGALLLDEHSAVRRVRCPREPVANSVGAGDSMVAGFLAGYLQTGDHGYALRLATAAGSATAFSLGLADREQVQRVLRNIL